MPNWRTVEGYTRVHLLHLEYEDDLKYEDNIKYSVSPIYFYQSIYIRVAKNAP